MDVFSVKRAIHSSILCVLFHSVVANSCLHNPGIFITPLNLEGLSGSCLLIPCNFRVKEGEQFPGQNAAAVWIKSQSQFMNPNSKYVVFNKSRPGNVKYPMEITGELSQNNCTTVFNDLKSEYTDKYFFRVEDGNFRFTASCSPVNITVRDSPWSPSLQVSGAQTESEVVTITCTAVTPCPRDPPVLTWDLHQGTANINETNSDGTSTTKITLNITLTESQDGQLIKCNASYRASGGYKMSNSNVTLSVSYGPKNTSAVVSPSGSLSVGQSVTLNCSSRAKPPVHHFAWFRHSSQGAENVSQGQTYSFNFTEEGEYYCVASNALRNQSSPVIQLRKETHSSTFPWVAIGGAGIGLIIVFFLAVIFMCVRSKRQASKDTQCLILQMGTSEEADKTGEEEETIHYGEINFSNLSPKEVSNTEQEETVYSQVQISQTVNANPPEDLNELYASVNKK